ncbi:hypothetical protein [Aestuariivita boseongensis]|uniref:hypothetical protein n=1 Tax=Aestuariivita boseongensis TaxID=1470562 RepID=UPI000681C69F|nr:hypothetical protein [Aestuariivita boseongensis]
MDQTGLAFLVFGALCLGALVMFMLERRAVARRKANGTYVDVSDIMFFGSEAVAKHKAGTDKG